MFRAARTPEYQLGTALPRLTGETNSLAGTAEMLDPPQITSENLSQEPRLLEGEHSGAAQTDQSEEMKASEPA